MCATGGWSQHVLMWAYVYIVVPPASLCCLLVLHLVGVAIRVMVRRWHVEDGRPLDNRQNNQPLFGRPLRLGLCIQSGFVVDSM